MYARVRVTGRASSIEIARRIVRGLDRSRVLNRVHMLDHSYRLKYLRNDLRLAEVCILNDVET